jgi:hypothetical protein
MFCSGLGRCVLRALKATSRAQCNDGYGADCCRSRRGPRRGAIRPLPTFIFTSAAVSEEASRSSGPCYARGHDQPVPLFQQLAGCHPLGRGDVRAAKRRGSFGRAWDRSQSRDFRFWWNRFGPMFAAEIRKRRRAHMRRYPRWRWHWDEVFVKVNGKLCYLWRAVDHEGEVLDPSTPCPSGQSSETEGKHQNTRPAGEAASVGRTPAEGMA